MAEEHTSVPRWPGEVPAVDPTGVDYLIVSLGPPDGPTVEVTRRWREEIEALGRPWRHVEGEASETALARAEPELEASRVGLRLMVAGPEDEVLRMRAAFGRRGLIDSEVSLHPVDTTMQRLWCSHCGTTTRAAFGVGDRVACDGCATTLLVHHHVARRHAGYLGFSADAEEA